MDMSLDLKKKSSKNKLTMISNRKKKEQDTKSLKSRVKRYYVNQTHSNLIYSGMVIEDGVMALSLKLECETVDIIHREIDILFNKLINKQRESQHIYEGLNELELKTIMDLVHKIHNEEDIESVMIMVEKIQHEEGLKAVMQMIENNITQYGYLEPLELTDEIYNENELKTAIDLIFGNNLLIDGPTEYDIIPKQSI